MTGNPLIKDPDGLDRFLKDGIYGLPLSGNPDDHPPTFEEDPSFYDDDEGDTTDEGYDDDEGDTTDEGSSFEYHVMWEIDVTAASPVAAAREARRIQRDPKSWATVFDVYAEGVAEHVDLEDADQDMSITRKYGG